MIVVFLLFLPTTNKFVSLNPNKLENIQTKQCISILVRNHLFLTLPFELKNSKHYCIFLEWMILDCEKNYKMILRITSNTSK